MAAAESRARVGALEAGSASCAGWDHTPTGPGQRLELGVLHGFRWLTRAGHIDNVRARGEGHIDNVRARGEGLQLGLGA